MQQEITVLPPAVKAFEQRNLKPVNVTIADQESVVITLVASGIGLAIMIEDEALEHKEAGTMAVWDEVVGTIDFNVVHNLKREKEALASAAIERLRAAWKD